MVLVMLADRILGTLPLRRDRRRRVFLASWSCSLCGFEPADIYFDQLVFAEENSTTRTSFLSVVGAICLQAARRLPESVFAGRSRYILLLLAEYLLEVVPILIVAWLVGLQCLQVCLR